MLITLETDNLAEIIQEKEKVVVLFMATWCGNCKKIKPKFKKLANEIEDVDFVIVDAEEFKESRKLAKITNLPTFASYFGGELLNQLETSLEEKLKELVADIEIKQMA